MLVGILAILFLLENQHIIIVESAPTKIFAESAKKEDNRITTFLYWQCANEEFVLWIWRCWVSIYCVSASCLNKQFLTKTVSIKLIFTIKQIVNIEICDSYSWPGNFNSITVFLFEQFNIHQKNVIYRFITLCSIYHHKKLHRSMSLNATEKKHHHWSIHPL